MKWIKNLFNQPAIVYLILIVWAVAFFWVAYLTSAYHLFFNPANQRFGAVNMGLKPDDWWALYVEVFLWSVAALLALLIIRKWRGEWKLSDGIVPFLFLNPATVVAAIYQPLNSSLIIGYVLVLAYFSRGYLQAWKMVLIAIVVAFGSYVEWGIAVSIAAFFYYASHWVRTRWYTSGILGIWTGLVIAAFFAQVPYFSEWSLIKSDASQFDLWIYTGEHVLFGRLVWDEAIYGWAFPSIIGLISVVMLYWWFHPWIRPRKLPIRSRDLQLLMSALLFLWLLAVAQRGFVPFYARFYFLAAFVTYWSSLLQRRWPKRTPKVVFVLLIVWMGWNVLEFYRAFYPSEASSWMTTWL